MPINQVLIIDTETTTDSQSLIFGWARLRTVEQRDDGLIREYWEESPNGDEVTFPAVFTVREVCFYADDLENWRPETFKNLRRYCETHNADIDKGVAGHEYPTYDDTLHGRLHIEPNDDIEFIPVSEFIQRYLLDAGYSRIGNPKTREYEPATITGFNVSFDIWRLTDRVFPAILNFYGGLAGDFPGVNFHYREMRAGIGMKREMTRSDEAGIRNRDRTSDDAEYSQKRKKPAYIVDLAELVHALTGRHHSLLSAGKAFGCNTLKYDGKEIHDPEANYNGSDLEDYLQHYISYGRNDVAATAELWCKVMQQFLRHPIDLRPDLTYSPASFSKQYIRDMGVHAPLCVCKQCLKSQRGGHRIPKDVLGKCMTAFYGGRSEGRVRLMSTPGVLVDWTSMYPTVMILLGIWELLTADRIECRDETAQVQELLDNLRRDDLYRSDIWSQLCGIADFMPNNDLGPVRAPYAITNSSASGIGINHLSSSDTVTWTLADLAASKILTGRTPKILRAWRFYASPGKQSTARIIKFGGDDRLKFDPKRQNLLKFLVEERQKAKTRHKTNSEKQPLFSDYDRCPPCRRLFILQKIHESPIGHQFLDDMATAEREVREAHQFDDRQRTIWNADRDKCLCSDCEIERFLKVVANAIYGVFAEMNRNLKATSQTGKVYGFNGQSWDVNDPEQSGEYCFPPFACTITGAARLMLAMLESEVKECGSTLLFCDTDSGCIPATATGEHDGPIAVLSYNRVNRIREKFNALNPYDRSIVPELVKWEYPEDDEPVYVTVISAKRYAMYHPRNGTVELLSIEDSDSDGSETEDLNTVDVVKRSEHGLGLYMNPIVTNPHDDKDARNPNWYEQAWTYIIRKHVLRQDVPEPDWFDLPAMSRFPIRTLHTWNAVSEFNQDLPSERQIKPFNFYLAVHATSLERLVTPNLRLITPFTDDPSRWLKATYIDLHTKKKYQITTDIDSAVPGQVIAVKTYRSVIRSYVRHPEFKYDDSDGNQCRGSTRGQLYPTHVVAESFMHISKDSSSISRNNEVFEYSGPHVYHDDSRERMEAITLLILQEHEYGRKRLAVDAAITEKQARDFLSGNTVTIRADGWQRLLAFAVKLAMYDLETLDDLHRWNIYQTPGQVLAAWLKLMDMDINIYDDNINTQSIKVER